MAELPDSRAKGAPAPDPLLTFASTPWPSALQRVWVIRYSGANDCADQNLPFGPKAQLDLCRLGLRL